ncbi:MAG: neutral zinc metallopeptidase, partial [Gammaproteobacteria bacterium]|nr:neutral zinc metallopeptidase [Gammaproteobacteria bacterium]
MRWRTGRRSSNVEDRRGMRVGMPRGRMGRGVAGGGLGVVVMVVIAMFLGVDPSIVLQQGGIGAGAPPAHESGAPPSAAENELAEFVSVVLADTEEVWGELFPQKLGKRYQEPVLVLFEGRVQSACGMADAAVGPFYCPGDQNLYLDLDFFRELSGRLGAPGDFAQAYVIAHEVGHHVQHQMGTLAKVQRAKKGLSKKEANALQVRVELQADCL